MWGRLQTSGAWRRGLWISIWFTGRRAVRRVFFLLNILFRTEIFHAIKVKWFENTISCWLQNVYIQFFFLLPRSTIYQQPCENKAKGFIPFHQQDHTRPHKQPLPNSQSAYRPKRSKKQFTVISVRPGCVLKLHFSPWPRVVETQVRKVTGAAGEKITLRGTSELSLTRESEQMPNLNMIQLCYHSCAKSIFCIHTCKTNRCTHMHTAISTYSIYNWISTCKKGGQNNLRAFLAILQ